jgi:phospholipid/cholesterol/gamma-HCH transport system ATP-binding protein
VEIAFRSAIQEREGVAQNAALVSVENVHKSFGDQKVLDGMNLRVGKGETLAVLGRSGTGKSVLLRIIIGLQQPDSGTVRVHNQEIVGLTLDEMSEIRKKMGFLFQNGALYDSLTVEQNVAFPMQHHKRDMTEAELGERVKNLLTEVGMEKAAQKMPSDLSGGMRKRVGLARALALGPDVLLLDEPTAGLDPISSSEIDDLVLKLQKEHQMASIVVTHDLHSARTISDRLALLDKGKVVIAGSFEQLQKSDDEFVQEFLKHA